MNKPILILGIVTLLLISGCAIDYNVSCLDKIANNFCRDNNFTYGEAERTSWGDDINYHLQTKEAYIECSKGSCADRREISCGNDKERFRYLQEELDKYKPK